MHDSPSSTLIPGRAPGLRNWRLADVIDFEFLLERDRDTPLAELEARDRPLSTGLARRDREIFNDRRLLFRAWLEMHRAGGDESGPLPGSVAVASGRLLLNVAGLLAVILGAGAAFNLLHYDGAQPINVATYLGWLVLVQIVLVVVAVFLLLLRHAGWLSTETSLLHGIIRRAWSGLALRLNRHLGDRVPAEHRQAVASFLGGSSIFKQVYGHVALWPMVGAMQWFGVCFNLAALVATLALVVFSDRAFGWQSAVNFTPGQIRQLTEVLAAPWSSLVPAAAAPTLEEIAGSRIVLKDGIKQLATENLVAWWPFLVAAVTFYGLLPRFVLWLMAIWLGRRALKQLRFDHVACDRLFERLQSGGLQTQAAGNELPRTDLPVGGGAAEALVSGRWDDNERGSATLLASPELRRQIDEPRLAEIIGARLHLCPVNWFEWSESSAAREAALTALRALRSSDDPLRLVLLEEAWQPPIAEKLGGFRLLRDAVGPRAKLVVGLVGRPAGANVLTPVRPSELQTWRERLAALADPQLRVEALVDQPGTNSHDVR